jgi:hypothetical protein
MFPPSREWYFFFFNWPWVTRSQQVQTELQATSRPSSPLHALLLLVPGPAGLTFRHLPGCVWLFVTQPYIWIAFGPLNPLATRPSVLDRNFRPPRCQMPPRGEILFTYPISYATPVLYPCPGNRRKRRVAVGRAANGRSRTDALSTLVCREALSAIQRC